ncbi:hypothetical protein MFUM_280010 [Methylacidiphilum fumariolicum SolV]|uniref:Uncharacterized protein n=2 Tax=Candidatus Methylacidiphilum fumarolicum TaxID=591154 RepID=I0JXM1_METFB|nr:conserved protein of unknown function [Candidatus Methylacidiphilum fumarolicum]CCG91990.1 hypothetical protein MFUM_280010 [Methylacidiphilum fumariolicum SolV]
MHFHLILAIVFMKGGYNEYRKKSESLSWESCDYQFIAFFSEQVVASAYCFCWLEFVSISF